MRAPLVPKYLIKKFVSALLMLQGVQRLDKKAL